MLKLLPNRRTHALFGSAGSRAIEQAALATRPEPPLMERAGLAVARLALALQPRRGTAWIVCGPGNNGGDGLVAARVLHAAGHAVRVSLVDTGRAAPADATAALDAVRQAGVPIECGATPPAQVSLGIDALLGLGLNRAPEAAIGAAIDALQALTAPILAVDLPSGLDADTGTPWGQAVRADHTLALLCLKPGLFTAEGRARCGSLWFDDLGVHPQRSAEAELLGAQVLDGWCGRHAAASHMRHKGSQGDVLVLGGAPGMRGAAMLAARAALAAGAGRVYGGWLDAAPAGADPQRPELMSWPLAQLDAAQRWRDHTLVCGCGGGSEIAALLPRVLAQARRLVLDADALNAVAADTSLRARLSERAARGQATVLTPHPLEAARLLDSHTIEIQRDRVAAAQALAERFRCTVVLKGSGSIIASIGRLPSINSSGSAALATAGSGDVLAGWVGGLWAQQPEADPHALAGAATFWHGAAGETQIGGPLRAADLIERMHAMHARPAVGA